jgi:hypothetical protein
VKTGLKAPSPPLISLNDVGELIAIDYVDCFVIACSLAVSSCLFLRLAGLGPFADRLQRDCGCSVTVPSCLFFRFHSESVVCYFGQ